jgi:hypothetical protein
MKRKIVLEIDSFSKHCGICRFCYGKNCVVFLDGDNKFPLLVFDEKREKYFRCKQCLNAEIKNGEKLSR